MSYPTAKSRAMAARTDRASDDCGFCTTTAIRGRVAATIDTAGSIAAAIAIAMAIPRRVNCIIGAPADARLQSHLRMLRPAARTAREGPASPPRARRALRLRPPLLHPQGLARQYRDRWRRRRAAGRSTTVSE